MLLNTERFPLKSPRLAYIWLLLGVFPVSYPWADFPLYSVSVTHRVLVNDGTWKFQDKDAKASHQEIDGIEEYVNETTEIESGVYSVERFTVFLTNNL